LNDKKSARQLTLDRRAKYRIKVPGKLDSEWRSHFAQGMTVAFDTDQDGMPVSILTGMFDQSALQGFLRHLYALGMPLLSVLYLGGERNNETDKPDRN
jgi:hypothetical protein